MKLYPLGMLKCPATHSHSPETRSTCIGLICIAFKQKWKQIIKKITPNKLPDRINILRLIKRPQMHPVGSMCVTTTASPYKAGNTRGRPEMDVCVRFNRHSGAAFHPYVRRSAFSYVTITHSSIHRCLHTSRPMNTCAVLSLARHLPPHINAHACVKLCKMATFKIR